MMEGIASRERVGMNLLGFLLMFVFFQLYNSFGGCEDFGATRPD
jgi:hypothetical protein